MIKHLVIVGLIIGGSHAGRMVMSQEGYQDMDGPSGSRGFGPSGGEFNNFDPSGAGSSMRGFPSSESSSEFGGPGGFEQGPQGPRGGSQGFGFNAPPPQNLDVMGGPGQFGPSGASGGEDDQPSGFPSSGSSRGPQMFDNFQGEGGPQGGFGGPGFGGPQGFGGPSQGFAPSSQEEGPATLINHQSFGGGESLGHPAFNAQGGFQDAEGDDQFVKDQDSKLSAQLMRDDGDDGQSGQSGPGQMSNFGGGSNSFDGPNGMSFDDGTKFGPDGGFQMSGRQPRTSLGGAWVGGNMISPKGGPQGGSFMGPQGLDGESQGVTRLDSATIGARSRQLGIRQPNPQPMNGPGPRGPIASSFNKFRPMMMGFRPPRRGHGGPPPSRGPPMMGAMSEPDFQVFKPQHPLSSRPALNFIPMGGEGGGFGGHRDMMADMARPHMMMASGPGPYGRAGPMMGGQDISNINTFIGVSGGSVGGGMGGRGYYKK